MPSVSSSKNLSRPALAAGIGESLLLFLLLKFENSFLGDYNCNRQIINIPIQRAFIFLAKIFRG